MQRSKSSRKAIQDWGEWTSAEKRVVKGSEGMVVEVLVWKNENSGDIRSCCELVLCKILFSCQRTVA